MSDERDELGAFLEAYELYFNGQLEYDELPTLGGHIVQKPYETSCCDCNKRFMRKHRLVKLTKDGVIWSIPMLCPECKEIAESGTKQPLPVAKVVKR